MNRSKLGLPPDWETVQTWVEDGPVPEITRTDRTGILKKKMPGIEVLENYRRDPTQKFWRKFPKFHPTKFVPGPVAVDRLEQLTKSCWGEMGSTAKERRKNSDKNIAERGENENGKAAAANP